MQINEEALQNLRLQFGNFKFKEEQTGCLIIFPWGLTNGQNDFSIMIKIEPDAEKKLVITDQASTIDSLGDISTEKKQIIKPKIEEIAKYYHLKTQMKNNNLCIYQTARKWEDLSEILNNFYTYGIAIKELFQTISMK